MKLFSLLALCSVLALATGCGWDKQNSSTCCTTTTTTATPVEGGAVEVQEEVVVSEQSKSTKPDKEDLREAELAEVMKNK